MIPEVITKTYSQLPFSETEILRYAQCRSADPEVLSLLQSCLEEMRDQIQYKLCYCLLPVQTNENGCDFSFFHVESKTLAKHLQNTDRALLFAATLGIGPDRLLARASRLSPARALLYQAIGTAQIEALCDQFCREMAQDFSLPHLPRFSPGYVDLPLNAQRDIFRFLSCEKNIGLTLNESLLMSPTKSVTAFASIPRQGDR